MKNRHQRKYSRQRIAKEVKKQFDSDATNITEEMIQQAGMLAREADKPDRERGLYAKYAIRRLDGSTEKGKKHNKCDFFVLDITHDPHATPAIFSYARSAEADGYTDLAKDLYGKIQPYIKQLNESMAAGQQLVDDANEVADTKALSDADLVAACTELWADIQGTADAALLSELLDRFTKLATKPKRKVKSAAPVKEMSDAIKKATQKVKHENTDSST